MKNIYCPKCKKLLFKATLADIEIKCGSCKRIVNIRMISQKALLLTPVNNADKIETTKVSDKKDNSI